MLRSGEKKAFYFVYRFNDKRRWLKLGSFPALGLADARSLALSTLSEIEKGNDPAALRKQEQSAIKRTKTFSDLCLLYLERHAVPCRAEQGPQKRSRGQAKN